MKTTKYILPLLFITLPFWVKGQEVPLYSNYTVNPMVYNPAHVGYNNEIQVFLHHRTQWSGFNGSPVTNLFTLSAPLKRSNSGIGLSIQNDQRGLFNTIVGSLKYAYHAKINSKSKLSLGIGIDVQNRTLRIGESIVKDIEDPLINKGSISETFLDASFGIKYNINKLSVGISVPQILEGHGDSNGSSVKNSRYYIGQASYLLDISSSKNIQIEPVILTRYTKNSPLQYDVNTLIHYKNMFLIGVGYRSNYAFNLHAGVTLKNIQVRYAYDFVNSNSYLNKGLSHEITLGYTFSSSYQNPQIKTFEEAEEPLSSEKIKAILNLLIDEFFDSGANTPEDIKRIELLKESIFNLLHSMENSKIKN